jgi:hypothetical protein
VTPEVLPTRIRATGHAFCCTMSRVGAFLTPFFVENSAYSLCVVGIVLGVLNIVAACCSFCLPETKGLSLDAASLRINTTERSDNDIKDRTHFGLNTHRHAKLPLHDLDEDAVDGTRKDGNRTNDTYNLLHRSHTGTVEASQL